jgi:hypothetical protein
MDGLEIVLRKAYQVTFSIEKGGKVFYAYAIRDNKTLVDSGPSPDDAWEKLCRRYGLRDIGEGESDGTYPS